MVLLLFPPPLSDDHYSAFVCSFLFHGDDCDRDGGGGGGGGGGGRDDVLHPGTRAFQEKGALSWF